MPRNLTSLVIAALVLLLAGLYIGRNLTVSRNGTPPVENAPAGTTTVQVQAGVPQKALDVLAYVRAHDRPMEGYVGGRVFGNYEHRLPATDDRGNAMQYREWDVNPREAGQNRGTERLITSADGRAWYTGDHYQTFIEIKTNGRQ